MLAHYSLSAGPSCLEFLAQFINVSDGWADGRTLTWTMESGLMQRVPMSAGLHRSWIINQGLRDEKTHK